MLIGVIHRNNRPVFEERPPMLADGSLVHQVPTRRRARERCTSFVDTEDHQQCLSANGANDLETIGISAVDKTDAALDYGSRNHQEGREKL